MRADVTIDGDTAVVRPATPEVIRALLDAADGRPVRTITSGPSLALLVDTETAERAGLAYNPSRDASGPQKGEEAPSRAASTATWRKFLDAQEIDYDPDANRAALIEAWDAR